MPRSLIDIEVNDEAFKKFVALFETYRAQVAKMPALMGDAEEATTGLAAAAQDVADATETTAKHAQSSAESFAAGEPAAIPAPRCGGQGGRGTLLGRSFPSSRTRGRVRKGLGNDEAAPPSAGSDEWARWNAARQIAVLSGERMPLPLAELRIST